MATPPPQRLQPFPPGQQGGNTMFLGGSATFDETAGGGPGLPLNSPGQQGGAPPTGLIGAEQALQGGLQGGLGALLAGLGQGRGDALNQLGGGRSDILNLLGIGGDQLQGGLQQALGQIGQGAGGVRSMIGQGQGDVRQQIGQGVSALNPFVAPGQQSQQVQAALSGALGPAAQAQAFQNFKDSPGQAFLQERGERAVTRNASALGGLGGGQVMQELQRQGQGLAQQDFANQFDRLGQLTGQGLDAGRAIGQLRGQGANALAGLGQAGAGALGQLGAAGANTVGSFNNLGTNLLSSGIQNLGAGSRTGAGLLAGLGETGGVQGGRFALDTGTNLATGRTNAGNAIANAISGTSTGLSDLINQQGTGLSDLFGTTGSGIGNLLTAAGAGNAQQQNDIMALLTQLAQSQGGNVAGLSGIPGVDTIDGSIGGIGQAAGGIGSLLKLSDKRLKTNIKRIGETATGVNLYSWDWNETGRRLAGNAPTVGVMAQDVPEAAYMSPSGFLMVDYSKVL